MIGQTARSEGLQSTTMLGQTAGWWVGRRDAARDSGQADWLRSRSEELMMDMDMEALTGIRIG